MLLNCGVEEDSRVPWSARKSNQSILKEVSAEYSLEGLMLKLKLQYFGHLMRGTDSLEKTWCWERLKTGGEGDNRGWDGWMASPTWWTWVWISFGSWWQTGKPGLLQSMGSQRVGKTEWLNWTQLNWGTKIPHGRKTTESTYHNYWARSSQEKIPYDITKAQCSQINK